MKIKSLVNFAPALIFLLSIVLLWEIYVRISHVTSQILPSPSDIIIEFARNWQLLVPHTLQTVTETMLGFLTAVILGLVIAIFLDTSSWIRKAIYPLLITSQTIPMIALAPLLLIWFGFDLLPKVIVVTLYCFFPIAIATANGFASVDQDLVKLLKSMKATYWQSFWLVRFPSAMPSFFAGLKIAATYSVTGAIVGEYVGAYQGLGVFIQTSANSRAIPLVFVAIVVTAFTSLFLFGLVSFIENILLPWRGALQK